MSDLEREYRRALRRYPRSWRRNHEDALLGVLLDNAEAEGREHVSQMDRRDLARNGRRMRAARVVPWALFVIALLVSMQIGSMLIAGVGPGATLDVHSPQFIPVPRGGIYTPVFWTLLPAFAVYVVAFGILLAAVIGGALLLRRNRRLDQAHHDWNLGWPWWPSALQHGGVELNDAQRFVHRGRAATAQPDLADVRCVRVFFAHWPKIAD